MVCWRCLKKLKKPDTERIGLKMQVTLECNCDRGFQIPPPKKIVAILGGQTTQTETAGSSRVEERIPTG